MHIALCLIIIIVPVCPLLDVRYHGFELADAQFGIIIVESIIENFSISKNNFQFLIN